ncbi:MAG: hypothetical protein R3B47_19460 [Bacteroidia bacterium]
MQRIVEEARRGHIRPEDIREETLGHHQHCRNAGTELLIRTSANTESAIFSFGKLVF